MEALLPFAETFSVTEAAERGLPSVVRSASAGTDFVIERHGKPQAVIVGIERITKLEDLERDLQSALLVLSRVATDNGNRTGIDAVIEGFGFSPAELRAAVAAEIAVSRK
jgi:antitoxin (DNA-binding transcriptional repressor) of toxin-antitoxin stability system